MRFQFLPVVLAAAGWSLPAAADWTEARCDLYP
jgi:hypothetical protein